jgi:hypothetical protein
MWQPLDLQKFTKVLGEYNVSTFGGGGQWLLLAGSFLSLLFNPEEGGSTFLQNVI